MVVKRETNNNNNHRSSIKITMEANNDREYKGLICNAYQQVWKTMPLWGAVIWDPATINRYFVERVSAHAFLFVFFSILFSHSVWFGQLWLSLDWVVFRNCRLAKIKISLALNQITYPLNNIVSYKIVTPYGHLTRRTYIVKNQLIPSLQQSLMP